MDEGKKSRDNALLGAQDPTVRELSLVFLLCSFLSFLILYFSSIQSPFYRYSHFWDANVYLGIGRAMQHGLMPYRDVFDHKGPLLYLLQYAASLVFPRNTYGVYILLSICLATFLFFGYRTARLFLSVKGSLVSILLLQFSVIVNSWRFGFGTAEEYLLPGLMACLYYLVRIFYIADDSDLKRPPNTALNFAFSGLWLSIVILIKYSPAPPLALVFCISLVMIMVQKGAKIALKYALSMVLGALAVAIPVLFYYYVNGVIGDMWAGYIEFNLLYVSSTNILPHVSLNDILLIILEMVGAIFGLFYLRTRTKKIKRSGLILIVGYIVLGFLFIYVQKRNYLQYFLPLLPFACFMWIALVHFLRKALPERFILTANKKISGILTAALILFLCVIMVTMAIYIPADGVSHSPKSEIEYYADEINRRWAEAGKSEPPRILNYMHIESGLMQLCNSYPMDRYFYMPSIYGEKQNEIREIQSGYIRDGLPDVIFTSESMDLTEVIQRLNSGYELITLKNADIQQDKTLHVNVYMKKKTD